MNSYSYGSSASSYNRNSSHMNSKVQMTPQQAMQQQQQQQQQSQNMRVRQLNNQQQQSQQYNHIQYDESKTNNKSQYQPSFNQSSQLTNSYNSNSSSQQKLSQAQGNNNYNYNNSYQEHIAKYNQTSSQSSRNNNNNNDYNNNSRLQQNNINNNNVSRIASGRDQSRNPINQSSQNQSILNSNNNSYHNSNVSPTLPNSAYNNNGYTKPSQYDIPAKQNYSYNNNSGLGSNNSTAPSSNKTSLSTSNSSQNGITNDIRNNHSSNRNHFMEQSNNNNNGINNSNINSNSNISNSYNPYGQNNSNSSQYNKSSQDNNYSLTTTAVSNKKVKNRKCGLMNIGNTCYMNSALQCLFNIPGFLEFFISGKYRSQLNSAQKGVANEFAELAKQIEDSSSSSVIRPSGLKYAIERVNQQFYGSGQQDAQELLRTLLDGLHNDLNRVQGKKPYRELDANPKLKSLDLIGKEWYDYYLDRDNSVITDIFTGQLMSKVQCQLCQTDSIAFDNFMDLSLSFTHSYRIINSQDLDRLIQAFLKEEALDDTYYCKSCKKHTKSRRQFFIWKLPDVLVIHLKRFIFGTQRREKLNQNIQFPIKDLNMAKYLGRSNNKEELYDLIGVLNHSGSLYGGHYTAQCKNPYDGSWNEFNDSYCREIDINKQQYDSYGSDSPYLLFYAKKNNSQKSSTTLAK